MDDSKLQSKLATLERKKNACEKAVYLWLKETHYSEYKSNVSYRNKAYC